MHIASRLLCVLLLGPLGCLLLADRPDDDPSDDCVVEDLDAALGDALAQTPPSSASDLACPGAVGLVTQPQAFAWTSPMSAHYVFTASIDGRSVAVELTGPSCAASSPCPTFAVDDAVTHDIVLAGETRFVWVTSTGDDAVITIGVEQVRP